MLLSSESIVLSRVIMLRLGFYFCDGECSVSFHKEVERTKHVEKINVEREENKSEREDVKVSLVNDR